MLGNFMTFTRAHHFTAFSCHCCSEFTNYAKLRTYGNKYEGYSGGCVEVQGYYG